MTNTPAPLAKKLGIISAGFLALALAGCSHRSFQQFSLGEVPPNYESRHPIELTTGTESTNINVSIAGSGLDGLQYQQVEAFGRAFRVDGEGALAVSIPVGAANERQAANIARDVRQILIAQGLPARAIVYRPYKAGPGSAAPPLILSYRRVRTEVASSCGVVDSLDIDYRNQQYQDFGCSTQNNFAAMLANPDDLARPRPMGNPSATRRATVLDEYAKSGNPPLTGGSSSAGSSSGSGS